MNNPVATVDIYDGNTFNTRVDFHGNIGVGVERAREYAEGQGEVIFCGRTMAFDSVYFVVRTPQDARAQPPPP